MQRPATTMPFTVLILLFTAPLSAQSNSPPLASVKDRSLFVLDNEHWHTSPDYWAAMREYGGELPQLTSEEIAEREMSALMNLFGAGLDLEELHAELQPLLVHRNPLVVRATIARLDNLEWQIARQTDPWSFDLLDDRQLQPMQDTCSVPRLGWPGFASFGDPRATSVRASFSLPDPFFGEAHVQIIRHDPAYPWALHDLVGFLSNHYRRDVALQLQRSLMRKRGFTRMNVVILSPQSKPLTVEYMSWTHSPDMGNVPILVATDDTQDRLIAGWVSRSADEQFSIWIQGETLRGWPVQLINQFLAEYPSTLDGGPVPLQNWLAADLAKCCDILRAKRDDEQFLQVAENQLQRYHEQRAFGIAEALEVGNDPEMLAERLDQVIADIETFVGNHPEYQVTPVREAAQGRQLRE